MQINQIEFYVKTIDSEYIPYSEDEDDTVSIIGKVKKAKDKQSVL